MKNLLPLLLLTLLLQWCPTVLEAADPPGILNHQGRIAVNGANFDGDGQFKFALVNGAGDTSLWSNDGTSTGGGPPADSVAVAVAKGHYALLLGDAPMTEIPSTAFSGNADVRLRIWFSSDNGNTFELLSPDRRITPVGYAMVAKTALEVPDGTITSQMLAEGSVTASKLAAGASFGGDLDLGGFNLINVNQVNTEGMLLMHSPGTANFFSGIEAGNISMTGVANTGVGANALKSNTLGSGNTAVGQEALVNNTTGSANTALGEDSLKQNTTGVRNTAIGGDALREATTASDNTAVGQASLVLNETGSGNTAVGQASLSSNTEGNANTAVGEDALMQNTTGIRNTAIGRGALRESITVSDNTAVGHASMVLNETGASNTALGQATLSKNTAGNLNTAVGEDSLFNNTLGHSNIALGHQAGVNLTIGSHNIAIGNDGVAAESATIRIGDSDQTRAFIAGDITTAGAVIPGNNIGAETAGMIRWTGTDFEGYTGSGWVSLTPPAVGAITATQLANDLTLGGTTSGVFSGTISGDGSGLTNIPASSVVTPPPGMVLIPAGTFTMGNSVAADTDITDAAPVSTTVSAFYMDAYEVTLSQWQSVYLWALDQTPAYSFTNAGAGKSANHPVQTVNWYDCVKWCNARSEQLGKTPVYYTDAGFATVYRTGEVAVFADWTAEGYRLPTEAEWEKGARGGQSGQRFPWGKKINQNLANYFGLTGSYTYDLGPNGNNAIGSVGGTNPATSPVGSFAPNGYGLSDMAGNVFEWCWDYYGTPYAGGSDPHGAASGSDRVVRGGSWFRAADGARCARRSNVNPGAPLDSFGFRVVLAPGQ